MEKSSRIALTKKRKVLILIVMKDTHGDYNPHLIKEVSARS